MRTMLAAASLVLIAACADRAQVTSPPQTEPEIAAAPAVIAARVDAGAAVDDALSRLLPGIETNGGSRQTAALSSALKTLGTTLSRGHVPQSSALDSLAHALDDMEAAATGEPGTLAELGAVRRVLDRVTRLSSPIPPSAREP